MLISLILQLRKIFRVSLAEFNLKPACYQDVMLGKIKRRRGVPSGFATPQSQRNFDEVTWTWNIRLQYANSVLAGLWAATFRIKLLWPDIKPFSFLGSV